MAATDVDHPLLGPCGAAVVFGPQKGADAATVAILESRNRSLWTTRHRTVSRVAAEPGAGAAGGIGAALLALGANRVPGADVLFERLDLVHRLRRARIVLTGEGRLDAQSLGGKLVVALGRAAPPGTAVIALVGQAAITPAELGAAGLAGAYTLVDQGGSVSAAMSRPAELLEALARRVAAEQTAQSGD